MSSGVALRNRPDMDDRWEGGRGPEAGEMVFASEQTDAWIRVANMGEDKWLPKKLLVRPTIWVPDGVLDHLLARETALARPNMPLLDRFSAPSFP